MKTKELQHDVFHLLNTKLPPHLYYHNAAHTQYVMNAAMELAGAENIGEQEKALLLTAALMHDVGFTETIKDHEEASCIIAKNMLPGYDYTPDNIGVVCELIMVTRLPQQAHTLLSKILCDADLFYLGTNDFFECAEKLFKEMTALHQVNSREEWNKLQVQFISSHQYFTTAANRLLYQKKLANLFTLKARMRHY